MASIIIRNLDDSLKEALRLRAAGNRRSMEEEARQLLKQAMLRDRTQKGLGTRIASRWAAIGGVDLPIPTRTEMPRVPPFPDDGPES